MDEELKAAVENWEREKLLPAEKNYPPGKGVLLPVPTSRWRPFIPLWMWRILTI